MTPRTLLALGAVLVAGCAAALAAPTSAPALAWTQQADSVRVVATWKPACDARGCPDSSVVTWTVAGVARSVRRMARTVDTLWMPTPAWGDSVAVTLAVAGVRRGLVSAPRTATTTVRRLDVAPPAPDSLTVDTLAVLDSFPEVLWTVRDTSGATPGPLTEGEVRQWCVLARNIITGEVVIAIDTGATAMEAAHLTATCERARVQVASERSG